MSGSDALLFSCATGKPERRTCTGDDEHRSSGHARDPLAAEFADARMHGRAVARAVERSGCFTEPAEHGAQYVVRLFTAPLPPPPPGVRPCHDFARVRLRGQRIAK